METGFSPAIIGAIIGGLFAVMAQFAASYIEWRVEKRRRSEEDILRLHSIFRKLNYIFSNNFTYLSHWHGCQKEAPSKDMELWQYLIPMVTFPPHVNFSNEEIQILQKLGSSVLANDIENLAFRLNSNIDGMREYNILQNELKRMLPTSDFDRDIGHANIPREDYEEARPIMIQANFLSKQIFDDIQDSYDLSLDCMKDFIRRANLHYGTKIQISLPEKAKIYKGNSLVKEFPDNTPYEVENFQSPKKLPIALLILRIGIGTSLLFWAPSKLLNPEWILNFFREKFALDSMSTNYVYGFGLLLLILILTFILGLFRTVSYGLTTLMCAAGVIFLFMNANLLSLPITTLTALAALFLLRKSDVYTLDGMRARL